MLVKLYMFFSLLYDGCVVRSVAIEKYRMYGGKYLYIVIWKYCALLLLEKKYVFKAIKDDVKYDPYQIYQKK